MKWGKGGVFPAPSRSAPELPEIMPSQSCACVSAAGSMVRAPFGLTLIEGAVSQRVRDTYGEDPRPHYARLVGLLLAGGICVWYFGQDNGVGLTFGALLWLMAAGALKDARDATKRRDA